MVCVSHNCDTTARIKFIFDTAIDDLEWKNPIDFGENRKNQNVKYDEQEAFRPFIIGFLVIENLPKVSSNIAQNHTSGL